MTKKRKLLLELVKKEKRPLNANQLRKLLGDSVDQSTIYRALQYLEDNSFLSSFIYDCNLRGVEKYYYCSSDMHTHYMHCESCHKFISFNSCPFEGAIENIENEYGFKVDAHNFTMSGTCKECSEKGNI